MRSGASESVRFDLAPIELTLQAVVTKGADGKIGWKILEFGAKYESAVTQTVKLTLSPTWADQIPNTAESSTTNAEKSTTRENHGVGVGMGPNIKLR
jgi:Trypsin-co-occurring domain 2